MSGPFCETCRYFRAAALSDSDGECGDPTKRISYGGNRSDTPWVHRRSECSRHTELPSDTARTLRDWFSGQALASLFEKAVDRGLSPSAVAKDCYMMADAMLAEREKRDD